MYERSEYSPGSAGWRKPADDGKHAESFSFACKEFRRWLLEPKWEGGLGGGVHRVPKGVRI